MPVLINLLNDDTRPKAPKIPDVTPSQRRAGQRLALFHRYHLEQIAEARAVMERVDAGDATPATLRQEVQSIDMLSNYRLFGAFCGRECQALNYHHMAEDEHLFPALTGFSEGLDKVVARLGAEHVVIHSLLEQLELAAIDAIERPSAKSYATLKELFVLLERLVMSHFGYEQTELEEAMGYYGVGV